MPNVRGDGHVIAQMGDMWCKIAARLKVKQADWKDANMMSVRTLYEGLQKMAAVTLLGGAVLFV